MTAPAWLEAAAARSAQEDWTLGHAVEQYRKQRLLSREGLASELGCPVETLHLLSLCRRPKGPERAQQLAAIAARFRVSAEKLELLLGKVVG